MKIRSVLLFFLAALGLLPASGWTKPQLLGIPVKVSENRGRLAVEIDGEPFIAAFAQDNFQGLVRNSLLLIDPISGETEQYWFPKKETSVGNLFHLLRGSNGRIYTTIGKNFVEFDLRSRSWSFQHLIDGMAMSFVEAPDGKVYFGTYPSSNLWEFDPEQRELRKVAQLDSKEKYPLSLVADQQGWIYAGIGTARSNLVAIHPESGERRQLVKESERKTGQGVVQPGADATVYGRVHNSAGSPWMRLEGGKIFSIEGDPKFGTRSNAHFYHMVADFPSGGKVIECDLPTKRVKIVDQRGREHSVTFDYVSNGPTMSSLTAGTDGSIYGSTNHPMHFWKWDPSLEEFSDFGGIPAVGGGNFPNLSAKGDFLVGPTYPNGRVYVFDTKKPWDLEKANPRLAGTFSEMKRPRVSLLLQDGRTVVMSGFPGYGHTGGGMVFYDSETDTASVVSNKDLLTGHSTVALRQLPDGTLVGGTSTAAPGGGERLAEKSVLYLMDPLSREILAQTEVGPDISSLEILRNGRVAGVARGMFFIYDPNTRKITSQIDISSFGVPLNPGQSLVREADGDVYLVLSESISWVDPDGKLVEFVRLPEKARAGTAIVDGYLYYAAGSHLWRYQLPTHGSSAPANRFDLPSVNTKELRQILATDPQKSNESDIQTPEAWEKKREVLKEKLWGFMGTSSNSVTPEAVYTVLEEIEMPNYRQLKISYFVEPDEEVRAYLLIPHQPNGAGVLCIHGTSAEGKETQLGVERLHNRDYGRFLANHGFVTLSPDSIAAGERFSELDKRPYTTARFQERHPNWSAVGKSVWDNSRALDILQTVAEVDPERMGAIGHSLGGYSSIWLAAFDERVRTTVSSCGLTSWQDNPRRYEFARQSWYVHFPKLRGVLEKNDIEGGLLPVDMYEYAALIAPRAFLNISGMTDKTYGNNETMPEIGLQLNALWNVLGHSEKFANFLMGAAHDVPDYSRLLALGWLEQSLEVTHSLSEKK